VATYQFSALVDNQAINFNPNSDILNFDQAGISAADVRVADEGASIRIIISSKDIVLTGLDPQHLSTSNITFANGSRLLFGDNTPGTANDNAPNSLVGTGGRDQLNGFGGADTLNGGAGDDIYTVGTGDVIIDSNGIDSITTEVSWSLGAGLENLSLIGSQNASAQGNDLSNIIRGNSGSNYIAAQGGDDTMLAGGGNDTIDMSTSASSPGNDYIDGGEGIDTLDYSQAKSGVSVNLGATTATGGGEGGTGSATVWGIERVIGGAFNDFMAPNLGALYMDGRDGNDTMQGFQGNDTMLGGTGQDIFFLVSGTDRYGNDSLDGGADRDSLILSGGFATSGFTVDLAAGTVSGGGIGSATVSNLEDVHGTQFADRFVGNAAGNYLIGWNGNDTLEGRGGNDALDGGDGADRLDGGAGDDLLVGGSPFDNDGADYLVGGDGNDTLDGDSARFADLDASVETLDGGLGDDYYVVDNPNDVLIDTGGVDTVEARNMGWTLADGFENLIVNNDESEGMATGIGNGLANEMWLRWGGGRLEGLAGNDTLHAGVLDSTLLGGDGHDLLMGSSYRSVLEGGAGNDTLAGGGGRSTGGTGADHFAPRELDQITDFASGTDRVRLDGTWLSGAGASGDFAAGDGRFYAAAGATTAHDASDRLIYNTDTGELYWDMDGTGEASAFLLATLDGAPSLAATDVYVINGGLGPTIIGTAGGDSLAGGDENNSIYARAGNDTIQGGAGFDQIFGEEGDDVIDGGDDTDWIFGGIGNDSMLGGDGDDVFDLFSGVPEGNYGNDTVDGGAGFDTLDFADFFYSDTGIVADIAAGTATGGGPGGAGSVAFTGIERIDGTRFNDRITGDANANTIVGGEGGDTLAGGAGNDVLHGDFGDPSQGLSGNTYVFSHFGDANADTVSDFRNGETIELDSAGFTQIGAPGRFTAGDERFHAAAGATGGHDANDRIIVDTSTGRVYYDADGNGTGAAQLIATFTNPAARPGATSFLVTGDAPPTGEGTEGDDYINGTAGNDIINAHGGNDVILPGEGNDTVFGGAGHDAVGLSGNYGNDVLDGGDGFDAINFGPDVGAAVVANFAAGTLTGGSGGTVTFTNFDVVSGTVFDDRLDASGVDRWIQLDGGGGNDTLIGGEAGDELNGWDGNDLIQGGGGDDTMDGFNHPMDGADTMEGGAGDDFYFVGSGDVAIEAPGNGIDTVNSDVSWALGDNFENLNLRPGAVTANGNSLNNVLTGNDGNNSSINGRAGNDTMFGMGGNDTFDMSTGGTSSYGNDVIDGGGGTDSVEFGGNARSGVTVNLAAGTMSGGGDAGAGSATLTSIENSLGGNFNDSLTGNGGANFFRGSAGNDTLNGGAGNDRLNGGAGNDFFVFAAAPGSANSDVVEDFATGVDKLQLEDSVFAAIGASGNFAAGDGRFWAAAGATSGHDANDRVIYNSSTGSLYYDADGSGAGAAQLIATLQGQPALGATDIAVI